MSSIIRIAASRANGAKSRGPVTVAGWLASLANSAKSTGAITPEGRARSSQNAIRHGILAESIVLDSESAERFSEVLSTLQEELQPASPIESRYVETMALAEWRRLRLICLEKEQMTIETRRQEAADIGNLSNDGAREVEVNPARFTALAFRALSDESRAQELLNRYEARYDRQYQRALNGLRTYRADKRKDEKEARRARRVKLQQSAKGGGSVLRERENGAKGGGSVLRERENGAKGGGSVLRERENGAKGERSVLREKSNSARSEGSVLRENTTSAKGEGSVLREK
ncbi:MAG TPA: hypothetical protein VHY84_07685 [Bryobacteraceae bacterium]|jgi:hypothetical protein|nr:hypothetical protein [Bryobacteraceae bacterium]